MGFRVECGLKWYSFDSWFYYNWRKGRRTLPVFHRLGNRGWAFGPIMYIKKKER